MKILVVENEYTGRLLLKELLQDLGTVDFAGNGIEGVNAVLEGLDSKNPYDLICLDIMMPGMDGLEALKQIRNLEDRHGLPPLSRAKIIITTVLSHLDTMGTTGANMCDAYLVKPIKKESLDLELRKLGLTN